MKAMCWLLIVVPVFIVGCTSSSTPSSSAPAAADEDTIKKNLDQLPPEDRKLAEEQKFCAVETENRLGKMGKPKKVIIKGEPVFLCCNSCKEKAEKDQEEVLAKAKELRAKNAGK